MISSSTPPSHATETDPGSLNFFPTDTSLHGVEFAANCPSDVSHRTRIIAFCGITDLDNRASPDADGWFLSNFWMFHYLFRGVPFSKQVWFTCCAPDVLVNKYAQYALSNPSRERKVVLEWGMLSAIASAGTVRVTEPSILLEQFVRTVEDECKNVVKEDEDVLILILGHGNSDNQGVSIGSSSNTKFEAWKAPQLMLSRLKKAISNKAKCALLSTSCYSGGWAMHPSINLTVTTAAGPETMSNYWQMSARGGFSGLIIASAMRDAIFASEVEDEDNNSVSWNESGEMESSDTYDEIGCLILDHLKHSDRLFGQHEISFAVQDDKWETC